MIALDGTTPAAAAASAPWLQIILAVVGVAGAVVGGWFTYKAKTKDGEVTGAQQLIDQYQEGRKEDQDRIGALEQKQVASDKRDTLQKLYIFALIEHIYKGNPPPPPAMPEGLM